MGPEKTRKKTELVFWRKCTRFQKTQILEMNTDAIAIERARGTGEKSASKPRTVVIQQFQ